MPAFAVPVWVPPTRQPTRAPAYPAPTMTAANASALGTAPTATPSLTDTSTTSLKGACLPMASMTMEAMHQLWPVSLLAPLAMEEMPLTA